MQAEKGFALKQQTEGKIKRKRRKEEGRKRERQGRGKGTRRFNQVEAPWEARQERISKRSVGIKLAEKTRELRLKSSWGLSAGGSPLILATAVPVKWWNQKPNCSSLRSARHIRH